MKKVLGYIFILGSMIFSYFRGKQKGWNECSDFDVFPFIQNSITIIGCAVLISVGIFLLKEKKFGKM